MSENLSKSARPKSPPRKIPTNSKRVESPDSQTDFKNLEPSEKVAPAHKESFLPKTITEERESLEESLCIWHHKPLSLYCEIREEPLCEDCLSHQYKNSATKIIHIDEAYRYRIASIYNTLSIHLFGRKEQLEAQSRRIEFRLDELRRLQNTIERDMQNEFRGIFERLSSSFNSSGGFIQSDIQSLISDLEDINSIIENLESSSYDIAKFLLNYKNIQSELERAISKPFRSDVKVRPSDLPRELDKIRALSQKCVSLQALVEFKNELIWKILHNRVPTCKISKEIELELKEWGNIAEKFSKELEKYDLMCDFCGAVLDDENANTVCPKNSSYSLSLADTSKYPQNYKGNSRHYFVAIPPKTKQKEVKKQKYADVEDKILQKISKLARSLDIDVERSFNQYDILNQGFLAPTDFYYVMVQVYGLNGEEITELIFRYDPKREGKVQYLEIIKGITAKLPEPYQKLRENAEKVLELCKKKDRLTEGAISAEYFKDVLRQLELNPDHISEVVKDAPKNNKGKILYSEFHDKII